MTELVSDFAFFAQNGLLVATQTQRGHAAKGVLEMTAALNQQTETMRKIEKNTSKITTVSRPGEDK